MKYVSIFDYNDFRKFVTAYLASQQNKGRGFFSRLAERLNTSNAAISQIFGGQREISQEHAYELGEELHLNEKELNYLMLLTDYSRTSSHKLKKSLAKQIDIIQQEQKKLFNQVAKDKILTEEVKSIYYSSWVATGLRNLIATGEYPTAEMIGDRLKLPVQEINKSIDFLLRHEFLNLKNGKLTIGPQKTHLEEDSPFVVKHHQNWRLKGMVNMSYYDKKDLFYTSPMSLSEDLAKKIRVQLLEFIKETVEQVGPSESETVRCLNIDWFQY